MSWELILISIIASVLIGISYILKDIKKLLEEQNRILKGEDEPDEEENEE